MAQKIKVDKAQPSLSKFNHSDLPDGTFYEDHTTGNLAVKFRHDYRDGQNNTICFHQGEAVLTRAQAKTICYPVEKIEIKYAF